eukprot:gene42553-56560_t
MNEFPFIPSSSSSSSETNANANANKWFFSRQSLSMSLYGLQGFSSEHKEVCQLLESISSHADALDSQGTGNALY